MDWWEIILFVIIMTPIVVLWLGCILDAITRPGLGGGMKVLWILGILLFPIVGSLIYILVRPRILIPPTAGVQSWQASASAPSAPDMRLDESQTQPRP